MKEEKIKQYLVNYMRHINKTLPENAESKYFHFRGGAVRPLDLIDRDYILTRGDVFSYIGSTITYTIYKDDTDMEGTDYEIPFLTPQLAVALIGDNTIRCRGKVHRAKITDNGIEINPNVELVTLKYNCYIYDNQTPYSANYWNPCRITSYSWGKLVRYYDDKEDEVFAITNED